jgi:carbon-monoxide dehydrogenase medium subunit
MIPAEFDYVRPRTIDEALDALADPDALAIAGGHSLVPLLKLRFARPSALVDLADLGLRGIRQDGNGLEIGAMTTYDELIRSDGAPAALRECAESVGDMQVRNAGTLGGAVAHADPASDIAAGILALGATIRLRSQSGPREIPTSEFFLGPFTTARGTQELVAEIAVPAQPEGSGSAYVSIEDPASRYAIVGAAVAACMDGDRIVSCSVGLTGAWAAPLRASALEEALVSDGGADARRLAEMLIPEPDVGGDDAEIAYRRHVASVVCVRALERAAARGAAA